ncbi:MAG: glycosyltransferase family 2 protein [Ruminococcus sp.]|jgi:glycosyltransferase involved in cell wall biosynthesis|nr:glycosyltransferase family 2 protein [Ruminococcus sp.]
MNVLTIGIVVRNEEAKLSKCLDSLASLREKVPSTLVITDNGSIDETKKIAKERADIYKESEVDGDFSELRNTVFESVNSEWFFYIDADETIEDSEKIIEFFTSGDYKNFDCASVNIESKLSNDKTIVIKSVRLCKFTPETRFEGLINETLITDYESCKNLDISFIHTGFMPDKIRARELRNVPILRKEIELKVSPDRVIKSYLMLGEALYKYDPEETEKNWEAGIKLAVENKGLYLFILLARFERYYFELGRFDDVYAAHERYKNYRENSFERDIYPDIEDAYFYGLSAEKKEDCETAVNELSRFEAYIKVFNNDSFALDRLLFPAIAITDNYIETAKNTLTTASMKSMHYDVALSRLMADPKASGEMLLCMDKISDFTFLPQFFTLENAENVFSDYLPKADHPIEMAAEVVKIKGEECDEAIIHRFLTDPFDPDIESLHTKKVIIIYLTKSGKEIEDLEYLTYEYINRVYETTDSIHYSEFINKALMAISHKSE